MESTWSTLGALLEHTGSTLGVHLEKEAKHRRPPTEGTDAKRRRAPTDLRRSNLYFKNGTPDRPPLAAVLVNNRSERTSAVSQSTEGSRSSHIDPDRPQIDPDRPRSTSDLHQIEPRSISEAPKRSPTDPRSTPEGAPGGPTRHQIDLRNTPGGPGGAPRVRQVDLRRLWAARTSQIDVFFTVKR